MASVSDSQQLFVGNLPHNCTEQDLRELFSTFGKVTDLRINQKTGRENQSKPGREGVKVPNFGFIVFDSGEAVEKALKAKPILLFGSHRLNVEEKKMRTPRDNMGGQGGFNDRGPPTGGRGERGSQEAFKEDYDKDSDETLPNKSALSQSITSSSGTATPIRTEKLQQDRLVARSKTSSQADRGSRRGTPRGGTPARSVADDNVKGKKSVERKVSVSESEHSTDSDGSRKGKFKFGPKSKHLLDLNPRISPRCHASTKALLNAGSVGDEDELADFLLMEEMSEGVQGRYPFVAHDESSNDSTFR